MLKIKSLKFKNSLIIISVMLPLIVVFFAYDLNRQTHTLRTKLHERGIILAQTGAETSGKLLTDAIKYGILSEEEVFDTDYQPIPGASPPKYHTAFDTYTDKNLSKVQDSFLQDKVVIYAVSQDINGYVPTHNNVYPRSGVHVKGGIGDNPARTKRIFNDAVGLAASQNTDSYLLQVYKREDTGEVMWDISAPIYVDGRHWGGFRVGFSIDETNNQIAAVRNQIIGAGITFSVALIVLILLISSRITDTVKRLEQEANRIASGDLTGVDLESRSKDELGSLIRSFGNMSGKLRDLVEKTSHSVNLVADCTCELQDSIQNAAMTADATSVKMAQLSKTMKNVEEGSEAVIKASEKTVTSLIKAGATSQRFLEQMKSSSVAMTHTGEAVKELESHVEKIGEIILFTSLIAEQASLLAQKAVSEAGSLNRPDGNFASLASEIQKRAQDAASATKGIAGLFDKVLQYARRLSVTLEKDQQIVLEGYSAAGDAAISMQSIITDMQNLIRVVKEVITHTQHVTEGIESVNKVTEEQATLADRFLSASETLEEIVGEMKETLLSLKL